MDDMLLHLMRAHAAAGTGGKAGKVVAATHPIGVLVKPAKAGPFGATNDERVMAIDESVNLLRRRPDDYRSCFGKKQCKIDSAVADLVKWRDLIGKCGRCATAAALTALVGASWDSALLYKVNCPAGTRTGKYVRKMFRDAAMRQWFYLAQLAGQPAHVATGVAETGELCTAPTPPPVLDEMLD